MKRQQVDLADGSACAASDWLDSPSLIRIAKAVALKLRVPHSDFGDFFQELRFSISRVVPHTPLNTSWIFRVAECRAKDLLRSNSRSRRTFTALSAGTRAERDPELLRLLAAKIVRLPANIRQILELQLEGYSEREIATKTSLSRKMVRTRIDWGQRLLGRSSTRV